MKEVIKENYDLAAALAEVEKLAGSNTNENKNKACGKSKPDNVHKDHRQRLDRKVENYDFETLPDHEQLEFILYVIIPQRDTNELAHRLLNHFGSFKGVLNAERSELSKIRGVGYRTAMFISQLNRMAGVIVRSQYQKNPVLETSAQIKEYIMTYYLGRLKEVSYLMFLDSNKHLIGTEKLSEGTTDRTHIYPREVVKLAVMNNASYVIIAHNHPSGFVEPSEQDINVTKGIEVALSAVDISLHDSVIVSGDGFYSFRENGYLTRLRWMN